VKLVIKSPFWDDLRKIGLRIAEDDPGAADRFFVDAEKSFALLGSHPRLGRLRSFSSPGVRSWVMRGFPNYIVFYLPTAAELHILAVIHGAQDISTVLADRLK
jgi:toxin ParE1/3/4